MTETTRRIAETIRSIPEGSVMSYGAVAAAAGIPNGARQVVRVLHALSGPEKLPWHRVIRSDGRIALRKGQGFELQKALLEAEGLAVAENGEVSRIISPDRGG